MKKLAPVWKVVIGLFQKDYHSKPVNKSYRKKQGTLVLFFGGGLRGKVLMVVLLSSGILAGNMFLIQWLTKTPALK